MQKERYLALILIKGNINKLITDLTDLEMLTKVAEAYPHYEAIIIINTKQHTPNQNEA